MTRERYVLVSGLILMGIGASFMLLTPVVVSQFLVGIDATPIVLALERNIGAALLSVGLVNVLAHGSSDARALKAVMVGTMVALVLTAALDVHAVLTGLFAPIGWGVVVFKAAMVGGFGLFVARLPRAA